MNCPTIVFSVLLLPSSQPASEWHFPFPYRSWVGLKAREVEWRSFYGHPSAPLRGTRLWRMPMTPMTFLEGFIRRPYCARTVNAHRPPQYGRSLQSKSTAAGGLPRASWSNKDGAIVSRAAMQHHRCESPRRGLYLEVPVLSIKVQGKPRSTVSSHARARGGMIADTAASRGMEE